MKKRHCSMGKISLKTIHLKTNVGILYHDSIKREHESIVLVLCLHCSLIHIIHIVDVMKSICCALKN